MHAQSDTAPDHCSARAVNKQLCLQSSSLSPDPQPLTIEWNFDGIASGTDADVYAYLTERLAPAIAATLGAYVNVKYPGFSVGAPHLPAPAVHLICVSKAHSAPAWGAQLAGAMTIY